MLLKKILYLRQTKGRNHIPLNNTIEEIVGHPFMTPLFKHVFNLDFSQMFLFVTNICFENVMKVVSLRTQENGLGLKYNLFALFFFPLPKSKI